MHDGLLRIRRAAGRLRGAAGGVPSAGCCPACCAGPSPASVRAVPWNAPWDRPPPAAASGACRRAESCTVWRWLGLLLGFFKG